MAARGLLGLMELSQKDWEPNPYGKASPEIAGGAVARCLPTLLESSQKNRRGLGARFQRQFHREPLLVKNNQKGIKTRGRWRLAARLEARNCPDFSQSKTFDGPLSAATQSRAPTS